LTISGNFSLGDSRSRPVSISWNSAVRIPCCISTRFDSALSSAIDSVAASDPVYGMPSSSHSAGTAASRFRPATPSAMLKHPGRPASSISWRGSSAVASNG